MSSNGTGRLRRMLAALVTLAVAVTAAACGDDDYDADDFEDGIYERSREGELPPNWPADLPVYPNAVVESSNEGRDAFGESAQAFWRTNDSLADVKRFYDEALSGGNWRSTGTGDSATGAFWVIRSDDGATGEIDADRYDGTIYIRAFISRIDLTAILGGDGGDIPEAPTPEGTAEAGARLALEERIAPFPPEVRLCILRDVLSFYRSYTEYARSSDDGVLREIITTCGVMERVEGGDDAPEDLPDDFPVYSGARESFRMRDQYRGVEGLVVYWETGDSLEQVKDFFDRELESGAWRSIGSAVRALGGGLPAGLELGPDVSVIWAVEDGDGQPGYVNAEVDTLAAGDKVKIVAVLGNGEESANRQTLNAWLAPYPADARRCVMDLLIVRYGTYSEYVIGEAAAAPILEVLAECQ